MREIKLNIAKLFKPPIKVKDVLKKNIDLEKLNNTIFELKELNDYGNVLTKLIEIRSKNRANNPTDTHSSSLKRLNDLIKLVENRKIKYQAERNGLKSNI